MPRKPIFLKSLHEIAAKFDPKVRRAFLGVVDDYVKGINNDALLSALASKNALALDAVLSSDRMTALMEQSQLGGLLEDLMGKSGTAAGGIGPLRRAGFSFDTRNPNVILAARRQTADLITGITAQSKEAIRALTAIGSTYGLTIDQQARAIREIVGLRATQVQAPLNLARDIRAGRMGPINRKSLLTKADKSQIARRIRAGTVDDAFVEKMQSRYSRRLLNSRASTIARTENLRAANLGQRQAWKQGIDNGDLPRNARRFWIVTADSKLSEDHAIIPSMNANGVGMDEAYETPDGPSEGPPLRPSCRCGEGLIFPDTTKAYDRRSSRLVNQQTKTSVEDIRAKIKKERVKIRKGKKKLEAHKLLKGTMDIGVYRTIKSEIVRDLRQAMKRKARLDITKQELTLKIVNPVRPKKSKPKAVTQPKPTDPPLPALDIPEFDPDFIPSHRPVPIPLDRQSNFTFHRSKVGRNPINDKHWKTIEKLGKDFNAMVDRRWLEDAAPGFWKSIRFERTKDRGFYKRESAVVNVGKGLSKNTVIHELGHHLEHTNAEIKAAAKAFLRRRWAKSGTQAGDLRGQTIRVTRSDGKRKTVQYWGGKGELSNPDDFFDPYVGRIYKHDSTEVISMGFEAMYKNPVAFYKADHEHFDLIRRIMLGENLPKNVRIPTSSSATGTRVRRKRKFPRLKVGT